MVHKLTINFELLPIRIRKKVILSQGRCLISCAQRMERISTWFSQISYVKEKLGNWKEEGEVGNWERKLIKVFFKTLIDSNCCTHIKESIILGVKRFLFGAFFLYLKIIDTRNKRWQIRKKRWNIPLKWFAFIDRLTDRPTDQINPNS